MQRDALLAKVNPCCKQNISTRLQSERARLQKHDLQGLEKENFNIPCVVGEDMVLLC